MIKICVTLNEGQGQYNEHVTHSHLWGIHHVKFDKDFDGFQGIACKGDTHTHTHTHTGLDYVNFFKVAYDFENT